MMILRTIVTIIITDLFSIGRFAIGYRVSGIGRFAIGYRLSAIGYRLLAIISSPYRLITLSPYRLIALSPPHL